jgi:hypothetical protein
MDRIAARVGWRDVAAVRDGYIYEVKSPYILQPGPAALTEGLRQLHEIIAKVVGTPQHVEPLPGLSCQKARISMRSRSSRRQQ